MIKIKKLTVACSLLVAAALAGCQYLPSLSRRPVKAAVYVGDGALGVGEYRWLQIAAFAKSMETTLIDAQAIREGALDGKDLLIMPSGRSRRMVSALGAEGSERIKAFIRQGGGYIGTSAGAFLVSESSKSHPGMLNLLPFTSRAGSGRADMKVRFNQRAADLAGIRKGVRRVAYAGGPIFTPSLPVDDAEVEIIATYDSSIATWNDQVVPSMAGQAAVVAGRVGKGRVFVTAVHPETDLTDHDIVEGALRFVTGRDITWEIPQRTRGQLAIGVDMEKGFATLADAEAMRALLLKREYDFISVNVDILNGGMSRHLDAVIKPNAAGFARLASLKELPNDAFGSVVGGAPHRRRGALSVAISEDPEESCARVRDLLVRDRRFDVRDTWDATSLKHLDAVVISAPRKKEFNEALEHFADNGGTVFVLADTSKECEAAEISAALGALCACPCRAARMVAEATSTDGQNAIRLYVKPLCYEVLRNGRAVVRRTPIDLELSRKGLAKDLTREPVVTHASHSAMTPSDTYRKSLVSLEDQEAFADFGSWGVRLVARNDGVAWRFETRFKEDITVTHERAGLAIPGDAECLAAGMSFVFKTGGTVVSARESDLYDFPAWNVVRSSAKGEKGDVVFESVYSRGDCLTRGPGTRTFPWRCFILADDYSSICESDIVYALARKNEDLFMDFSWVRPGKVVTNGGTTAEGRDLIDFAARNGIAYVVMDEPTLVQYGLEKGVGIILSKTWTQIDGDEERMAEHFAELGVKGVRVDFTDCGDARSEHFRWKFADACARHKLLVCWRGAHGSTGQERAYPNVVDCEAAQGLEEMKLCEDPGAFRTRSRQMALADFHCGQDPECLAFMAKMPVVWEDVKGLGGMPDTYAAVARKAKDGAWWVSVLTNREVREIAIDTSFLGEGEFEVEIFRDAPDCATEPTHYVHESFPVEGGDTLKLALAPGGGAALRITHYK